MGEIEQIMHVKTNEMAGGEEKNGENKPYALAAVCIYNKGVPDKRALNHKDVLGKTNVRPIRPLVALSEWEKNEGNGLAGRGHKERLVSSLFLTAPPAVQTALCRWSLSPE